MSPFGAGIRRGVMGGDQFTQIANSLFRDSRLTFKAKGLFGCISTHRTGWQMTVADLVRAGPDGRDAVRAGLSELQTYGYLVREQLRHETGMLAEIVYSITDQPATGDRRLAQAVTSTFASVPTTAAGRGFGAGIRRGVMGGDQFTQIANHFFREDGLTFKAKGLFGLLSTHRDGWRMTVAELSRRGRDGEVAVKSGLKELEKYGFLLRERERRADGTLGAAAYFITDLPSLQSSRSQPRSGFPPVDDPTSADRPPKNTNRKKKNNQNTSPVRPCVSGERTAPLRQGAGTSAPEDLDPGARLLLSIGAAHPELLLQEKALKDQGRVMAAMLDAGWSSEQLRHVITSRPLPRRIRTSVDAIVAARLRSAQLYPPPDARVDDAGPRDASVTTKPTTQSADTRTVSEATTYRALVECAGCGRPGTAPGEDLCPACLDWPPCRTCAGPTPRRARPGGDGRCATCTAALTDPLEASTT
ncbi:hypothetical protein [Streptomyces chartreusis]|uniref:hypothetical protein n=1 Tax=Streptomyces chartreusis TaxID=1969 RepID=UPI0037B99520